MPIPNSHQAIRACRDAFVKKADMLAGAGSNPVHIVEGLAAALVDLNGQALGPAALVTWLRDAADHIEAGLIGAMPPVQIK